MREEIHDFEKQEDRKFLIVRGIVSIIAFFGIALLIWFKIKNPDNELKNYIFIGMGIVVFWIVFFFGTNFLKKVEQLKSNETKEEKLPPITPRDECRKIIKEEIENEYYQNHIKSWESIDPYQVEKNLIYCFRIELLYEDEDLGSKPYVLVNSHFPNERFAIINENAKHNERSRVANNLSTTPSEDPEVEETETMNALTGTSIKTKKVIPKKKEDKENKKEEKKDLD